MAQFRSSLESHAIDDLRSAGRRTHALYLEICDAAIHGEHERVLASASALLDTDATAFAGWSLPIEPAIGSLGEDPAWREVLVKLADRAK